MKNTFKNISHHQLCFLVQLRFANKKKEMRIIFLRLIWNNTASRHQLYISHSCILTFRCWFFKLIWLKEKKLDSSWAKQRSLSWRYLNRLSDFNWKAYNIKSSVYFNLVNAVLTIKSGTKTMQDENFPTKVNKDIVLNG